MYLKNAFVELGNEARQRDSHTKSTHREDEKSSGDNEKDIHAVTTHSEKETITE